MKDARRRSRILVVDDCSDTVEIISTLMRILGHECRGAQSGLGAIQEAVEFEPDIVLLDLVMPDVSGYTVARQLRARCGRKLYMAALTGCGMQGDRERTRAHGFDDHLVKPVDRVRLTTVVEQAEQRHRGLALDDEPAYALQAVGI